MRVTENPARVTIVALAMAGLLAVAVFGKIRARTFAHGLVAVEALLAAWLVSGRAQEAALVAAAILFGSFAAGLGARRFRGQRTSSCSCFGAEKTRPTMLLAARAAALAAVCAFGATNPGTPDRTVIATGAVGVLAVAVAVLSVLVIGLYRQVGVLHARIGPRMPLEIDEEGPPIGAAAPSLAGLVGEGGVLIAFLGVGCRVCVTLEPALRRLPDEGLDVRIVYDIEAPADFAAWNVPGTPFLVHVVDGVVRSKGLVNTVEEIDALLSIGYAREAHAAR